MRGTYILGGKKAPITLELLKGKVMYTYEEHASSRKCSILDPDGDEICVVESKCQAEILIIHLNRGQ